MRETRKAYEEYLNDLYSPEEAWEVGCYMYKTNRGYIKNYGTVLRRKDTIAFNLAYEEWRQT